MGLVDLKCVFLNAENLFLLFDQELPTNYKDLNEQDWRKLSTSVYPNKPLRKVLELAKVINELNPDIILLAEVGGEESLANWSKYFLNSNYSVALIEGNSDRSIDVGYLIHKRCQFHFNIETNKNRILNFVYPHELNQRSPAIPSHKFSRDVAELHLFSSNKDKPFFIFLLAHLKSPLDPGGIDSNGCIRREAELKALLEIFKKHETRQVPIAVLGDFNGNASRNMTEKEFTEIYSQTDLEDIFEIAKLSMEERATYHAVRNSGKTESRQIDYCFLSKLAQPHFEVSSGMVYRYKNELGQFSIPKTMAEKDLLPSDHFPIVFELKGLRF
jgi:hypothetical protein